MFISVDLPAPFSPRMACTSPARTSTDTSVSAATPAKCLEMPAMASVAGLVVVIVDSVMGRSSWAVEGLSGTGHRPARRPAGAPGLACRFSARRRSPAERRRGVARHLGRQVHVAGQVAAAGDRVPLAADRVLED